MMREHFRPHGTRRPSAPKAGALPGCATPRTQVPSSIRCAARPLQPAQRRSKARARAIARPRWLTACLAVGLTSPKLAPNGG